MTKTTIDPRFITLGFSVIAAIAAGTPYLYGVYSPQLIARCKISAESAATISFASNLGSGFGGFPAGLIIDKFGVRLSLLLGSVCLLGGYGSLYHCFLNATSSLAILSISIMFVGFGSIISYFSTLKACTANFPHHRGTAGAFAVSSFGLSALIFSGISAYWFSDDTEGLLRFLSLCCGISIAFSSFFIKLHKVQEEESEHENEEEDGSMPVSESNNNVIEHSAPQDIKPSGSNLNPFLSAHRGSFAQINFNESASSLFSYASSLMSKSSTSVSSYSTYSSTPTSNRAIQVPPPRTGSINNINNTYYNSSPTSSRLSANTSASTSPAETNKTAFHQRSSSSKGVYFGLGGMSPRNSFSTLEDATLQKKAPETPPVFDEQTPLIEAPKKRMRKSKKRHTASGHVKNLVTDRAFLLHYLMVGLLSSVGHLYIYSVGFMVRALCNKREFVLADTISESNIFLRYFSRNPSFTQSLNGLMLFYSSGYDAGSVSNAISQTAIGALGSDSTPEAYQALQVSILAFGSFSGRLLWGPLSDLIYKEWKYQRMWLVLLSNLLLLTGQIATILINDVTKLSVASIIFGIGYGSIFGVYPAIIAEEFGSQGFTTSWGLICTGPLIGLYFLTKMFGQNIDRMSEVVDGEYICVLGNRCYKEIFKINAGLCIFVALLMSGLMYQKRT